MKLEKGDYLVEGSHITEWRVSGITDTDIILNRDEADEPWLLPIKELKQYAFVRYIDLSLTIKS